MISHVSGRLTKKNAERQAVELWVNGVGYEILLPNFVWRSVSELELGEEVEFETLYYVPERPPIPILIGFQREVEREFFKKLIEVPDLGPTRAMRALAYSVSSIATWIEEGDEKALRGLPGVGERLAKTIVAHLKGKVVEEALLQDEGFREPPPAEPPPPLDAVKELAVEGLVRLGYKRSDASRWVEEVTQAEELGEVEEIIRAVFRMRSDLL
ncbi:MAG: Holliday junction branch migration protein RuvA [Dehalococcoidia bacterium]